MRCQSDFLGAVTVRRRAAAHRSPTRRRKTHSAQNGDSASAYSHQSDRARGARSAAGADPTAPERTAGRRGQPLRRRVHHEQPVAARRCGSYTPAASGGVSATPVSPAKRRRRVSGREAPPARERRRWPSSRARCRGASARARPARIHAVAGCAARTSRRVAGQPVEDRAPQRGERVGAPAAAELPAPQAGGARRPPRGAASTSPTPAAVRPSGARAATSPRPTRRRAAPGPASTGGSESHGSPPSAASSGDGGAPTA